MLEIVSPILRVGRVVSFYDAAGKAQAPFDHQKALDFSRQLQTNGGTVGIFLGKEGLDAEIVSLDAVPMS